MKYLGINLAKYVQELYEENYKTLMNKIKEKLNKWRDILYSWIGRLNIVKMLVLPNLSYRFNGTPITIPASYFVDINILILKFIWKGKRPRTANTISKEKKKVGRLTLPDLATVIKTVWYW
uniref:Reverse transcriptase domain-containing protein n=1 Tax=Equus caballus TaxID=9796 RepID=A0A9L0RR85_HORSE